MVQAGNDWKLWSVLAGGTAVTIVAALVARRRRRRTLRERLAQEIDLESTLTSLREAVQEVRERLPVHDGKVARSIWGKRVKPLVQQTARTLPEHARSATAVLEAERAAVEKLQRQILPATEQAARQAALTAERALQRAAESARTVPKRLPLPSARSRRPGLLARLAAGARDTAALGFWMGAAAALVYFGLLRPEQRERLQQGASSFVTQLRELWADFSFSEEPLPEFTE